MLSENCFETYEQSRISRAPRRVSLNPVWIRVQQRMGGTSLPILFLSKPRKFLNSRSLPGSRKFRGSREKTVFVCLLITGLLCAAIPLGGCSRRGQEPVLEPIPETVPTDESWARSSGELPGQGSGSGTVQADSPVEDLPAEASQEQAAPEKLRTADTPELRLTEDARTEGSNSSMAYGAYGFSAAGDSSGEKQTVTVHVCGAVQNEGVYTLPAGSLVRDALKAAGGFSADADTAYINLAAELQNASQIRFPTKEETTSLRAGADSSALYGEGAVSASGEEQDTRGKINLNTATKEELMRIPGIGESKAQRILDYREQNGGFQKIEDLMKVPGIKDASFQKMKDYVSI